MPPPEVTSSVRAVMARHGDGPPQLSVAVVLLDAPPPLRRDAVSLRPKRRAPDCLLLVADAALYLLPGERLPLPAVTEAVVHTPDLATEPALELRIARRASDGATCGFDTRTLGFTSARRLQEAVAALAAAAPAVRLLFIAVAWPSTVRDAPAEPTAAPRPEPLSPEDRHQRISRFRERRATAPSSSVAGYGPGRFTEAAEVLTRDLERLLHATGGPSE